ncbi:MAG: ABC transporter permease [Verrucomicrobiota bacterium]|nr:ABC transporter permease [Limisphaera sp.]MDW8382389.1 ABC transporter permease [Verrucomicrobiota bacterium]
MSRLPFELLLALRYLRPKRSFVSVITLISVCGVMLGVAVLLIVISVMSGFDRDLRDRVFGFNAHARVVLRDRAMTDWPQWLERVGAHPMVRGAAPFVLGQVLVETQPAQGQPRVYAPVVRGCLPEYEARVSALPRNMVQGRFELGPRDLLVGTVFAETMGLRVGDRVSIYSWQELRRLKEAQEKNQPEAILPLDYTVRGVFDAGYYEFNANVVITRLEDAQELFDLADTDAVHGLMLTLRDPLQPQSAARALRHDLGPEVWVSTWMEDSPLMLAVVVEKNVMLYILFFIVLVAAFGITCTLITFVMMKTREIGILKALGATHQQVLRVFLGQSLIVSVAGVAAGVVLGLTAIHYRNQFLEWLRRLTGFELFPASIYGFDQLPALVLARDVIIICGGSLLICLLAAAFPARYASRLNPVEALRHE